MSVEVLTIDGEPIPGFTREEHLPMEQTDGLRLESRWKSQADLSRLKGRTVRLKFTLSHARLFAFQVTAKE